MNIAVKKMIKGALLTSTLEAMTAGSSEKSTAANFASCSFLTNKSATL